MDLGLQPKIDGKPTDRTKLRYLTYAIDAKDCVAETMSIAYPMRWWRPSLFRIAPAGLGQRLGIWSAGLWATHMLGILRNRDYGMFLLYDGDLVVHRTCVVPACFRWPFMASADLQVCPVWTDPDYRGRGLATWTVRAATFACRKPGRCFWYLTREENAASITVCTKAGFRFVRNASRTRFLGLECLGQFVLRPEEQQ